ncbi:MAG: hypothetical protein Q7S87_08640 [Agitococcus sp.]|nr:hypothetical protein [Agitococcus sp.]
MTNITDIPPLLTPEALLASYGIDIGAPETAPSIRTLRVVPSSGKAGSVGPSYAMGSKPASPRSGYMTLCSNVPSAPSLALNLQVVAPMTTTGSLSLQYAGRASDFSLSTTPSPNELLNNFGLGISEIDEMTAHLAQCTDMYLFNRMTPLLPATVLSRFGIMLDEDGRKMHPVLPLTPENILRQLITDVAFGLTLVNEGQIQNARSVACMVRIWNAILADGLEHSEGSLLSVLSVTATKYGFDQLPEIFP